MPSLRTRWTQTFWRWLRKYISGNFRRSALFFYFPGMIDGMDHHRILHELAEGNFSLACQFVRGSNYTFLGTISAGSESMKAVYKPIRGEMPLWDFPANSLAKREVAAYLTSQFLGWNLVPPTIYRRKKLPLGPGMLQYYIEHDPNYHYFNFNQDDRARLRQVAVFDLLINNADRKGSHVLKGTDGNLWCIDHGVCFHTQDKLRTVIWDFAGMDIPDEILSDLSGLLLNSEAATQLLKPYLRVAEIRAMFQRAKDLLTQKTYRLPSEERRMYPYPAL